MTLLNESRTVGLQLKWTELMIESAQFQYDIAVSKYNSEVLTESKNEYILMEAEDAVNKSKGALRKAIDKVIGFIKSVASKIASAFSRKKVQNDLDEIKSTATSDPKLNGLKAQIPDYKQRENDIAEYEKAIQTAKTNAKKNGKVSDQDRSKIEECKNKCSAKVPLITVGVVSSAAAIGALLFNANKRTDKLIEDAKTLRNDHEERLFDLQDKMDDIFRRGDKIQDRLTADKKNLIDTKTIDQEVKKARETELSYNPDYSNMRVHVSDSDKEKLKDIGEKSRRAMNAQQKALDKNYVSQLELDLEYKKARQELLYGNAFKMLVTAFASYKQDKKNGLHPGVVGTAIDTVSSAINNKKAIKNKSSEIEIAKKNRNLE